MDHGCPLSVFSLDTYVNTCQRHGKLIDTCQWHGKPVNKYRWHVKPVNTG